MPRAGCHNILYLIFYNKTLTVYDALEYVELISQRVLHYSDICDIAKKRIGPINTQATPMPENVFVL